MKFNRVTEWAEVSDCGGYSVCAAKMAVGFRFSACRLRTEQKLPAELLGTFDDAESARAKCAEHADRQRIAA